MRKEQSGIGLSMLGGRLILLLAVFTIAGVLGQTCFAQGGSFEKASAQLHAATLTLRIIPNSSSPTPVVEEAKATEDASEADEMEARSQSQVVICTGCSLGDGLVVTHASMSRQDEIRITIPGGEQAKANLRVIDHVSGLTLLEIDDADLPGLSSAKEQPKVGQWVLAAAAWGAEKPVVSFGILSGTDRTIRGANFPAMLQCDLRTADTSSGSPLVNRDGDLIGIVVAAETSEGDGRWTYAVPVRHVQRMVRARHPDKVVEIQRRRPIVGLKLVPGEAAGTVMVGRVEQNGPASKAGIQPGDQVLAAEGFKVRSVYQVVRPLLSKQPGDTMNLLVKNQQGEREVDVVLGGGTVITDRPTFAAAQNLAPRRIVIEPLSIQGFDVRNGVEATVANQNAVPASANQQLELLQKAVDSYGSAIATMKQEIDRRDAELAERDALIQKLQLQLIEAQRQAAAVETGR